MKAILRSVGAMVAAIATALVLLIAVEFFSSIVHPVPEGFTGTMEEMCLHVERYPHWVLAASVPMWGFTALASTWLAGWLGNRVCAWIMVVLFAAAVIWNVSMLPYTPWFKIVAPIVVVAGALLGCYLSPSRPEPGASDSSAQLAQ